MGNPQEEDLGRLVLAITQAGVWDCDFKRGKVFYSEHWKAMRGFAADEIGDQWHEWSRCIHPADREFVMQALTVHCEQKIPFDVEYRVMCKDSSYLWIRDHGQAFWDEAGNVVRMVGSNLDISDRKQTEAALQLQLQQSQLLSDITIKISQSSDLNNILQTAVSEVQQFLQADRVLVLKLRTASSDQSSSDQSSSDQSSSGQSGSGKVIQEAVTPGWTAIQDYVIADPCLQDCFLEQYRYGRISAINDLDCADIAPCYRTLLSQFEIKANVVVSIVFQNHLWGLLIAHQCSGPRQWLSTEIELLQQIADQIGLALVQVHVLDQLELKVKARTRELTVMNIKLQQEIDERRQAQASLRQSEALLRLTANSLPVLIAYVDRQQCYQFVNQTYAAWHGKPREDIIGGSVQNLLGEAFYQQMKPNIEEALSGCKVQIEKEIPFAVGGVRYISGTYIPDFREGAVQGFFFFGNDVTQQKEVERMKDEFISVISHELRTPLTSIYGAVRLLATSTESHFSEADQTILNIAVNSSDRLVSLVNDVLDLERIASGKAKLVKQFCNAADLLSHAVEAMRAIAQQQGVTLSCQALSVSLWADPEAMHQALSLLLSNAIKFSAPGTTVSITVENQAREIVFTVHDQGRGIPVDQLERIFERFQQVDASDSRAQEGTGLGLAICQNIIHEHGGRIWAESVLEKGSSFCFTIPKFSEK